MKKDAKIFVSHHTALIGSAIVRKLNEKGFENLVFFPLGERELVNQEKVVSFFEQEKPDCVFLAATPRWGILANDLFSADVFYETVQAEMNILQAAYQHNVDKLLFVGSSNVYPRLTLQPMEESEVMTGEMEPTQEPSGLSALVGIKFCEYLNQQKKTQFTSVIPSSVYGNEDYYHREYSHVVPGLLRRFHEAKENADSLVHVWGKGNVSRDFLYADDLADACLFLMSYYEGNECLNIGSGKDTTIKELVEVIQRVVGYDGKIYHDSSKPVGMPRKMLDVSKLTSMGWSYDTELEEGIRLVYKDLLTRHLEWAEQQIHLAIPLSIFSSREHYLTTQRKMGSTPLRPFFKYK